MCAINAEKCLVQACNIYVLGMLHSEQYANMHSRVAICAQATELGLGSSLMQAVCAGGDFGGMVAYVLGALHSEHCAAVHSNITICLPSFANPWTMLQASLQPTL